MTAAGTARGWRAYVMHVRGTGRDEVVFYCPTCAVAEFGPRRRARDDE